MAQQKGKLTEKQAAFVQEYLIDLNATQAAIRAGYSAGTANRTGARMLSNAVILKEIQKCIGARNQRTEISQDRILEELASIAFGDLRDVVTWGASGIKLKNSDELTPEQAAAISEVSESVTSTKVKRHDKVKALELLMRHKGMLNDKLNIGGELNVTALEKARERAKKHI